MARILIIDDEPNIVTTLSTYLGLKKHSVAGASQARDGLAKLKEESFDIILLDVFLKGDSGLDSITRIKEIAPGAGLIMISGHADVSIAVQAIRLGAFDFMEKPIDTDRLDILIANILRERKLASELGLLKDDWMRRNLFMGSSKEFRRAIDLAERAAPSGLTVLITGPNGTGKEAVAHFVWMMSAQSDKPMITVNCAAIPRELFESELFGHTKGAFTGATSNREGYFGRANGGTLFLDEIAEIPIELQSKLLRAIEYGEVQRPGGSESIKVNVRVIAATNRELGTLIEERRFREDLYYRLNQVPIQLPSLGERRDDIPAFVDFFSERISQEHGTKAPLFLPDAIEYLSKREYPGNVRELRNLVERAIVLATGPEIAAEEIESLDFSRSTSKREPKASEPDSIFSETMSLKDAKLLLERRYVETQLRIHEWSVKDAADALGLLPNNLSRKITELGIRLNGEGK